MTQKIPYATRYKTTLSQDEDALAAQAYGRNATPKLVPIEFQDKKPTALSTFNLLKANLRP